MESLVLRSGQEWSSPQAEQFLSFPLLLENKCPTEQKVTRFNYGKLQEQ